jgi:flavin-dependent dehydrogenase
MNRFDVVVVGARCAGSPLATMLARRGFSVCLLDRAQDALLLEAAREAGADVRTGSRVTQLVVDDGRVAGVETDAGPIHARLVVGADGRHSTVASLVGASEYHVSPPGRMAAWPELAEVIGDGRRVGPIRVLTKWHGYFRQSAGPGWVLVGDAGHFKDPTPGQGISDAFRQAEQLAAAIEDGLGNTSLESATERWWRWRDKDAYEMYWFASDMGEPGVPSPLNARLLRDIAVDPEATRTFFRVLNHEIRPSELLTTPRLARTAVRALRDRPDQMVATLKEIIIAGRRNARRARRRRVSPPGMTGGEPAFARTRLNLDEKHIDGRVYQWP